MSLGVHIILVDDDPQVRSLAARLLRSDHPDAHLTEVADAAGFARALDSASPCAVITDYQLGWTDGLAVLRAVKARWPDCPVIMFTGTGSEEIAVEAMKAGLDDYVLKSPKHLVRLPAAVRAALDARAQRARLDETEARYRHLFERMPVGIFCSDPSGAILDANRALLALLGCPDLETLRRAKPDAFSVEPESRPAWVFPAERQERLEEFERQVRRLDGRLIWIKGKVQIVRDANGRVLYHEGFVEDITDLKRMEAQAGHTARLAALGQLASAIAHQIRNPLFILTGYLQLLQEKLGERADAREVEPDVEKAKEAARRITQIIEGFLKLAGPASPRKGRCTIPVILHETLALLASELTVNRIEVATELPPDLPPVEADPQELREIFLNLLLNASQAMAQAHGRGTLTVKAELSALSSQPSAPEQKWIDVRIQDDGPGIPPELRIQLFEPFFTTKPPGQGTGLGLWTVQRIVMALHGTVACETEPGRGATFIVRLPAA